MNPPHREGWPPSQGPPPSGAQQTEQAQAQSGRPMGAFGPPNNANANSQPSAQASPSQGSAHVLPPPSGGPFYSSSAASAHNQNLPALSAMSGGPSPQPPTHQAAQRPPSSESGPAAMSVQGTPQAPSYSLPGISQTLHQPQMQTSEQANMARERELREHEAREREIHAAQQHAAHQDELKRQAEQRDREIHERQQQELAARENHAGPMQIHQPVAVAPSARSIHGPNGLLGQPGPLGPPPSGPLGGPLGGPNAPAAMFGNAPGQPGDTTPRMQHAVQPPHQTSMLVPFGGPPGAPMAIGQGQQPILNDALSYLDQVKVQFADHPDVYNRFLDIMKDFKSSAIDTPGVIERVSTLFAGNPDLIQGFNTFLPPGYKIECGTNGDPNNIRVTTPMGTMVSTIPTARPLSPPRSAAVNGGASQVNESPYYDGAHGRQWQQGRPDAQEGVFSPDNRAQGLSLFAQQGQPGPHPLSPEVAHRQHAEASAAALAHQQEQRGVSQLQNAVSAATGRSILSPSGDPAALAGQPLTSTAQGGQVGGMVGEKRGPVEFNHAISYVNKIKNRFAQQPDIYKQFLEILQTYQRESKPIQDVYAQVTSLFSSAPDLLEDFKQFLPESAAQHRAQQQAARHAEGAAMLDSVRGEPSYSQAPPHQQTPRADTSRLPPMGNFAPTPTANRDNKRKRGDRQGPGPAAAPIPTQMQQEIQTSSMRGTYGGPGNVNKRAKTGHPAKQTVVPEGPPISPTLTPALPVPLPPSTTTTPTQDELAFFDRVKKFLANKNAMNEFLKLINLFSQDLIDKQLLLFRAQAFIGGNQELYNWFKNFIGGDDDEAKHIRPKAVNSRVSLSNCRSFGPSYRLLPKRERERLCSGRDELCRSVLNDEWASHPTWASEDSGFVAHRKNTFEEGLHRIEEERHDYDFNIEACARTIQQLEPIAQQLYSLKGEDRLNFTVPPGLGGQSQTIYKRVIMKIYGREKGAQVAKELFNTPWSVVPVLLHRLKSKLEDWKAAQREWEKVWREQTQKIFWRSLDHQSLSVKQNDKRQFQPKSLLNEIQVRYEEQKRLQEIQEIQQPDHQFAYSFNDEEILYDIAKLMLTYADNNNGVDFSRVVPFIKEFIPLFFGLDANKFEQRLQNYGQRESSTNESADEMPSADEDVSQRSHKLKKGDLRRGVLDPRGKRKDKEDSVASASRDTTPDVTSAAEEDTGADSSHSAGKDEQRSPRWIDISDKPELFGDRPFEHDEPYSRSMYNLYANSSIYCFFRMFVYLYERLLKLKENEETVRTTVQRAKAHKPAMDLKMIDKTPDDFFRDTSESANYYQQILDMLQEQIQGEIDMNQIEEVLRRYYLQVGWQLYSFDRLMGSLLRFSLAVVSNDSKDRTLDIYNLFKRDRVNESTSHKAEIAYRKAVAKFAKDADTYRIAYDSQKKEAYVRLFKKDDPTYEFTMLDRVRRWRAYSAAYYQNETTEGVDMSKVEVPFCKRSYRTARDTADEEYEPDDSFGRTTIQINPVNYTIRFISSEPYGSGGVEHIVHSGKVRSGLSDEGVKSAEDFTALKESRRERAQELLVRNTNWMKDVSRDDVDARKAAFKKRIEQPEAVAESTDVEMTEA
ncbi:paired amphipathic helix protein Sin3a [Westerdykella ornata]|uniref:Paired amphipathic helix protein Sin3a n=1 Tax=Westerdykella ornata TaxID=318751 RepID=A0A6A6JPD1_WESOR|nr:paired amphipathic helix protein Sin3a [Westerdykella ornata]KAF2278105.1 paired amphipathic helix protein Sin3a [Westerdykella ornata]